MTDLESMKHRTSDRKYDQYFQTEHLKSDLKGRSVRGGAVTVVSQVLKFGLTLASNIVLARLLAPADYGLIGMVTAVTGLVSLFKDLGLSMATVQKPEITHKQVSTLFWINVLVSAVTMLLTIALAPLLVWFYGEPRLLWITIALASGFIFGGLTVQHQALLNRQMRFKALSTINVISMALSIVVATVAARLGAGYWALVILQVVIELSNAAGVWIMCGWRPGLPAWRSGIRSMLAFGRNLTGFNIINYFARNLDNVLIGRYWGAQQLGLYAKAYQLLLFPLIQINSPIAAVAIPTLSRLADSPERYRQAYLRVLEKIVMVTTPLIIFMIATSDWILLVLLGPQWVDASRIFALLGIVALIQPVANTTGWIFITQGRTNHMFQWGVIGSTLSILSIVIGLPWGATGVAASYAISGLVIRTPILFWYVGRSGSVRTRDLYRALVPSTTASLCALAVMLWIRFHFIIANPLIGILVELFVAIGVTFLVLMALPNGRVALWDLKSLFPLMIKRKRGEF